MSKYLKILPCRTLTGREGIRTCSDWNYLTYTVEVRLYMSRYGKYDLRLYKFLMPSVKLSVKPCGLIGVCNCSSIVEVLSTVAVDLGDSSSGRSVSFSVFGHCH